MSRSHTRHHARHQARRSISPAMMLIAVGAAVAALSVATMAQARVAEPPHQVTLRDGSFELRTYAPQIAAEVIVPEGRGDPANAGFETLADYIFGGNTPKAKIAMTAPVTTHRSRGGQKIAMTAPVTTAPAQGGYQVRFIMPAEYTMETLPRPTNPDVRLVPVPEKRFAVVRFSGFTGADKLKTKTDELRAFIQKSGLSPKGEPVLARYDPPWTLPMMRRNEIWLEVG
jgi:SOUL heme-binding protein